MVALHEEEDTLVYGAVSDFSESQGRTSETSWKDATVTHPHLEMIGDYLGFTMKLLRMAHGFDSIWVIVNRLI